MKIVMLTGSPHLHGSSNRLADEFAAGATAAGHQLLRFDIAKLSPHPCLGCMHCRQEEGRCVYDDGMAEVIDAVLSAELIVLVTPLYYFGMTAQLKAAIDRFFAANAAICQRQGVQALLLAACGDRDQWAMDGLREHFRIICRYLGWRQREGLLAFGVNTTEDLTATDYLQQARALGAAL